jgi:ubiquinone biosynthesis protein COQ9
VTGLEETRDRILMAALEHVIFDGWTERALRAGAADTGIAAGEAMRAFPGGATDLVAHFTDWADRRMLAAMETADLSGLGVSARVTVAVRLRLEQCAPWREAVRRAVAFLALPQHAGLAARLTFRTVDAMWYAAGDTSADFSYYTKRATLAAVYTSTLLVWLDDTSEDFEATWSFLERRIADVGRFHRLRSRFQKRLTGLRARSRPFDPAR